MMRTDRNARLIQRVGVIPAMLAVGLIASAILASTASAQTEPVPTKLAPPTPGKVPSHPTFVVFIGLILIVAATAGANSIPAKRSHQD